MGAAAAPWETALREEEMAALRVCACGRRNCVAAARVGDGCVRERRGSENPPRLLGCAGTVGSGARRWAGAGETNRAAGRRTPTGDGLGSGAG
jgi:hypothetical protein